MLLNVNNDANFLGANVKASLKLDVGNNLNLVSLKDEYSFNNKGSNVSLGGGSGSFNVGMSNSNGTTVNKNTILSNIIASKVDVNVKNNTYLKGSLIASGEYDNNKNFVDNKTLNFNTNTLSFENSSNNSYSFNRTLGANVGYSSNKKDNTQEKRLSSVGYQASNSLNVNSSKTLATLGQGNINVKDIENSSELERLNTNILNINKDLYSSSTGTKVDATLDARLLTEGGREEIGKEYKDMNKNMSTIAKTLPDENSDNFIEKIAGFSWNFLTKYATLGIVPSNENNGGILAQIPVLTGVEDSEYKILQIVNKKSPRYNEQDYIKMENSNYYKSLSTKDQELMKGQNLYVSKESIVITKDTATYQNSINGMMNNVGEAIKNVLQQTGQIIDSKSNSETKIELNVNYNPSYGFLGDFSESIIDKYSLGTTGIAKQTGKFIHDTIEARGSNGSNFAMHSQANNSI